MDNSTLSFLLIPTTIPRLQNQYVQRNNLLHFTISPRLKKLDVDFVGNSFDKQVAWHICKRILAKISIQLTGIFKL